MGGDTASCSSIRRAARAKSSLLRIVNPGVRPAHVSIGGIDDVGKSPGEIVQMTTPAGAGVRLTAAQLERGDYGFHDRAKMGDGRGNWRFDALGHYRN